jgi:hypothetical protein
MFKGGDIPSITMHQPGLNFGMTEIIPSLENITEIWDIIQNLCEDAFYFVSKVIPNNAFNRAVSECVILKLLLVLFFLI